MTTSEKLELVPPNEELLKLTIQVANLVGQLVELLRTLATPQWILNPPMESSTGTMPAETGIKYCPCGYGPLEDDEEMCTAGEDIQRGDDQRDMERIWQGIAQREMEKLPEFLERVADALYRQGEFLLADKVRAAILTHLARCGIVR